MANSDYLETLIMEWLRGSDMPSAPATVYIGLSTADPLDDGSGLAEPVAGGYARQAISLGAVVQVGGRAQSTNDAQIDFSASADWGLITHAALFDALSAGNLLRHAALDNARNVGSGDTFTILTGALITEES